MPLEWAHAASRIRHAALAWATRGIGPLIYNRIDIGFSVNFCIYYLNQHLPGRNESRGHLFTAALISVNFYFLSTCCIVSVTLAWAKRVTRPLICDRIVHRLFAHRKAHVLRQLL